MIINFQKLVIGNLRAIGYGRKKLEMNTENLKSIDEQLDEMIENSIDRKLENEELEIES